jgi:hypothetical protein
MATGQTALAIAGGVAIGAINERGGGRSPLERTLLYRPTQREHWRVQGRPFWFSASLAPETHQLAWAMPVPRFYLRLLNICGCRIQLGLEIKCLALHLGKPAVEGFEASALTSDVSLKAGTGFRAAR